MILNLSQIPKGEDQASLRAKLAAYRDALDAHALTVGTPKPLPPYEFLVDIEARGRSETLDVFDDSEKPVLPPADTPEMLAAKLTQEKRAAAVDALLRDFAGRFPNAPQAVKDFAALP